jgi:hypothetical protein
MLGWSASRCRSWIGNASPLSVLGRSSVDASEQLPSSCFFSEHLPTLRAYVHTRYTACQGSICQARPLDADKPNLPASAFSGFIVAAVHLSVLLQQKKELPGPFGKKQTHRLAPRRRLSAQQARRTTNGAGKSKSRMDQEGRSKN